MVFRRKELVEESAALVIDEHLCWVLFGLESQFNVEFDRSVIDRMYMDHADVSEVTYTLWDSSSLKVTGEVPAYEPGWLNLTVMSEKPLKPSLKALVRISGNHRRGLDSWEKVSEVLLGGSKWDDPTSPPFRKIDWSAFDVSAIVGNGGFNSIIPEQRELAQIWLKRLSYNIVTLDCSEGLNTAIPALGRILKWEELFGYVLESGNRDLDRLKKGFEFNFGFSGRVVFEIVGIDPAWTEDPKWFIGLLSIAREYSVEQLARGNRFFTLLVMPETCSLIGAKIYDINVPGHNQPNLRWIEGPY